MIHLTGRNFFFEEVFFVDKHSFFLEYMPLLVSLVAASAWFPYIHEKFFSKASLQGKLISNFPNVGEFNQKKGIMHFLAINVVSLNGCFNIKSVIIKVKYKNESTVYIGKQCWAVRNEWTNRSGHKLRLNIQPEDSLLYIGTIPQNVTKVIYLTFFVDKAEITEFDEIIIEITECRGNSSNFVFTGSSMDGDQMLWDDRIWKKVD